jgi:hypothetical protein
MTPTVPCSECVSSLLRCCRLNAPGCESTSGFCTPYSPGYYTTLHTPRPVRPYTNSKSQDRGFRNDRNKIAVAVIVGYSYFHILFAQLLKVILFMTIKYYTVLWITACFGLTCWPPSGHSRIKHVQEFNSCTFQQCKTFIKIFSTF